MTEHSSKQEFFESKAKEIERWRRRHRYYWKDLTNLCAYLVEEDASVLEVGCGTGDLLFGLRAKEKTGIDFSAEVIRIAKEKYVDVRFEQMRAEKIQLTGKFDYIILSNVIGYLDDIQIVFEEIKKLCHPQTKIVVTYYNFIWQPVLRFGQCIGFSMKQPQQNWLSAKDIENLLYLSGFETFKTGNRVILPVYVPLLSLICNKYLSKVPLIRRLGITNFVIARPEPLSVADSKGYSVSVIIPARNESGNLEAAILRTPEMGIHTELILIEGHSTDGTWAKMKELARAYGKDRDIKVAQQPGKGKADAVRTGFEMATGDILMILDADLTVSPEDLPKFYNAISSGKGEFINGSRLVYEMDKKAMRFLNILANKIFSLLFSWLLDQRLKDTLCGTKVLFRSDYIKLKKGRSFFGDFDPFGDYDLIFGASKLNLKILDLPVRYKERGYGRSNINRFRHGLLLLRMCAFAARKIKFT